MRIYILQCQTIILEFNILKKKKIGFFVLVIFLVKSFYMFFKSLLIYKIKENGRMIHRCPNCEKQNKKHELQDNKYGTFNRQTNPTSNTEIRRCTVCNGDIKVK